MTSVAGYAGGKTKEGQIDVCTTKFAEAYRQGHTGVVKLRIEAEFVQRFASYLTNYMYEQSVYLEYD